MLAQLNVEIAKSSGQPIIIPDAENPKAFASYREVQIWLAAELKVKADYRTHLGSRHSLAF